MASRAPSFAARAMLLAVLAAPAAAAAPAPITGPACSAPSSALSSARATVNRPRCVAPHSPIRRQPVHAGSRSAASPGLAAPHPFAAISGPLLLLALLSCSVPGALVVPFAVRRLFPAAAARRLVRREIRAQRRVLRVRRLQLVFPDPYGGSDPSRWEREKRRFCRTRLLPILRRAGLQSRWPALEPYALHAIERAARRPPPAAAAAAPAFTPTMDPAEYERFCARMLRRGGWNTRVCGATGDQGADIIATRNGTTLVVQCKRYGSAVGNAAVQQAAAARAHHRTALAAVVSNARFTEAARRLAHTNAVHLLHHEELPRFRP